MLEKSEPITLRKRMDVKGDTVICASWKYMKTFGMKVDNEVFKKHSWYFRNALVRANYNDLKNGIHATTKYLELFFNNLLIGNRL